MGKFDKDGGNQPAGRSPRVWSTELINQMMTDYENGYDIDYSPFFEHDIDLKAENISFDYTDKELEEIDKCYNDPKYFIERYCRWMTDHGMQTVTLRPYQKDLIDIVTSQDYDAAKDLLVPKNRNIIWMAARQSGKCSSPSASITYNSNLTKISESKTNNFYVIWNKYKKQKHNLLYHVKNMLYWLYSKL